jgi:hypothetical protein
MNELREKFSESEEPSFVVFFLASWLRKYPYELLTLGLFTTLATSWASQLRSLFQSGQGPDWQFWTLSFVGVGQSELVLVASLIFVVSSGKLRNGLAKALRGVIGITEGVWFVSSLLIYRWAAISDFHYPLIGIGLLYGLVIAALHLLMFWWATDPRTLRPYDPKPFFRPHLATGELGFAGTVFEEGFDTDNGVFGSEGSDEKVLLNGQSISK